MAPPARPPVSVGTDETLVSDDETRPPSDRIAGSSGSGATPLPTDPAHLPVVSPSVYVILDEVGRGGLGRIVRARDARTGRIVAIKEMRVDSPDAAVRFVREALVTANLQHPSIVPVYEVGRWASGESAGRPFYAMKLVTGRPLSQVIAGATDFDRRLALLPHMIAVADALAHAHGERVIHRDLKPANVMVGAHGETVVIDWGLARRSGPGGDAADPDSLPPIGSGAPGETVVGSILGTPQYMAPEQARGDRVDERADVYALGAMLYHLLAGQPPYDGLGTASAVIDAVRTRDPVSVVTLAAGAPRDLVAIVERAMARDPATRYATAAALADDLRRFATGQLVSVHRYSRGERVRRLVRRYRAVLAIAAAAAVALAVTGGFSVRRVMRERETARAAERGQRAARAEAEHQRSEAQAQLASSLIERARTELDDRQPGRALPLLAEAARLAPDRDDLRVLGTRAATAVPAVTPLELGQMTGVAYLPGGDVILARENLVERRSLDEGVVRWTVPIHPVVELLLTETTVLCITDTGAVELALDDGRGLARFGSLPKPDNDVLSADLTRNHRWLAIKGPRGDVEVWDVPARRLAGRLKTDILRGYAVASPDGRRVAVSASGMVQQGTWLYDVATGARLRELCPVTEACGQSEPFSASSLVLLRDMAHHGGMAMVFDWDGNRRFTIELPHNLYDARVAEKHNLVVVLAADGTVQAHDLTTGRRTWSASGQVQGYGLVLDENRGRVWAFGRDGEVTLLDLATGGELGWWWTPESPIGLFPRNDGDQVLILDESLRGYLWHAEDPGVRIFAPTPGRVWRLAWLDDARLVTGSQDGTIAIHDAATGVVTARLRGHDQRVSELAVTADGHLLSAARDDRVILWDPASGTAVWTIEHLGIRAAASPDDAEILVGSTTGEVWRFDAGAPAERTLLGKLPRSLMTVTWSPDGRWIAAIDDGGTTVVWRASDGVEVRRLEGYPPPKTSGVTVVFSPDGRWLFPARVGQRVLLDLEGGHDVMVESSLESIAWGATFSPDGARLIANDDTGDLMVWSTATGKLEQRFSAPAMSPAMRFSKDGKSLYAGGIDHVLRVWDVERGALLATYAAIDEIYSLELSPDGKVLALTTLAAAASWRTDRPTVGASALAELARCRSGHKLLDGRALVPTPRDPSCGP